MTSEQVIEGVLAWVRQTIPALVEGYDYVPAAKGALPDVVADLNRLDVGIDDPRLPFSAMQQRLVWIYEIGLSFMVNNDDPEAAAELLRGWADALAASLLADGSLGDRVPLASPIFSIDFSRPFVEYDDGTRGREVTMALVVGDFVEDQQ